MTYPRIEKPTEPGCYWFRILNTARWQRIEVGSNCGVLYVVGHDGKHPNNMPPGDWRGPIPEPTE